MSMTTEEFVNQMRMLWPDKSDEWLAAYLTRLAHYVNHEGDMTGAPGLPEESS